MSGSFGITMGSRTSSLLIRFISIDPTSRDRGRIAVVAPRLVRVEFPVSQPLLANNNTSVSCLLFFVNYRKGVLEQSLSHKIKRIKRGFKRVCS